MITGKVTTVQYAQEQHVLLKPNIVDKTDYISKISLTNHTMRLDVSQGHRT